MKITCHACDAKYTIADEKVTGRTVKIKCKKCGATIVVNADTAAAPQLGGAAATPYAEPQAAQAGGGEDDSLMATRVAGADAVPSASAPEWTVSLGDQERQMSPLQIAEEMQRGTITGDTYVWRDGMADWLAVAQVPELAALLARAAQPAYAPAAQAPVVQAAFHDGAAGHAGAPFAPNPAQQQDEPVGLAGTIVMTDSAPASPYAAPRPAAGAPAAAAPAAVVPTASSSSPGLSAVNQPTAARRANRAGASVDVFAAAAGTREAAPERPRPPTPAGKLGERNENSVLFSLSALTATENAAAKGKPDDAVLDLGLGNGRSGGAVDDLMNIGGGAIGGPMLAPPPLLAPVVEPPPAPAPAPVAVAQPVVSGMGAASIPVPAPPPKSKTGLIAGIIAAVAVVGGVAAVFALGGSEGSGSGSGSANAAIESSGAPATPSSAPATSAAPTTTAATDTPPVASGSPTGSSAAAPSDSGGKAVVGSGTGGTSPKSSASSAASSAPTASAKTDTPAPTASAAADSGGSRDFNKGAATTALSAAAAAARGCKTADGPTGSASVRVVFAPSGNVTSANVQGPPFAGTPVGGCIAAAFRGAHVPPFDGSPVAVNKTVNIN